MEVNIVRLHLTSGLALDVDTRYMLSIGVMPTDSFDAVGDAAAAVKDMIVRHVGLDSTAHNGHRSVFVIEPGAVLAYEERELA